MKAAGRLRVALTFRVLTDGGAEHTGLMLARQLSAPDFETTLCVESRQWLSGPVLKRAEGVAAVEFGTPSAEDFDARFDVLIGCAGSLLPETSRALRVVMAQGANAWMRGKLASYKSYRGIAAVAVSKLAATAFPPGVNATVLYNGVDLGRLAQREDRDAVRRRWGIRPDEKLIGYCGRIEASKRAFVGQAVAEYLGPPYRAVFVGPAGELEKPYPAPQGANLQPWMDNIGDAYRAFDVLLSASPSEGFGYTYVEAMMCRCPVVAHPTGILAETPLAEGSVAKLLPFTATLADFAAAVREAADRSAETGCRVVRGHKWAMERFTEEAAGRRWRRFLLKLAET